MKDPLTGRVYLYPAASPVREPAEVISSRYLSEDERITIADRYRAGHSLRSIAAELGRAPSIISPESPAELAPGWESPPARCAEEGQDRPVKALNTSQERSWFNGVRA